MTPPEETNALVASVQWIQAVLLGPLASSLAVIAVACVGLLMLSGRINVRRGATVILGCFIVFGAAAIAGGLRDVAGATVTGSEPVIVRTNVVVPPSVYPAPPPPVRSAAIAADPYAGAAVRH